MYSASIRDQLASGGRLRGSSRPRSARWSAGSGWGREGGGRACGRWPGGPRVAVAPRTSIDATVRDLYGCEMDSGACGRQPPPSEYPERGAAGEVVHVTDRGRPRPILAPAVGSPWTEAGVCEGRVMAGSGCYEVVERRVANVILVESASRLAERAGLTARLRVAQLAQPGVEQVWPGGLARSQAPVLGGLRRQTRAGSEDRAALVAALRGVVDARAAAAARYNALGSS